MNDPFISLKEIQDELNEIENLGSILSLKLSLVTQKIKYLFSKIKSCETIDSAQKYFDVLDMIQLSLATLIFKENLGIPERLRSFVSDFDNLEQVKEYYFKKIKNDEYSF